MLLPQQQPQQKQANETSRVTTKFKRRNYPLSSARTTFFHETAHKHHEVDITMTNYNDHRHQLSSLDSPHHNQTIKSSAKIADMKKLSRLQAGPAASPTITTKLHRKLFYNLPTAMSLVTLLLVVVISSSDCLATIAQTANSDPRADATMPQAKAEALISSNKAAQSQLDDASQQNVILIKYANVSSTSSKQEDGDNQLATSVGRLNVYQLYNEPLSVSVIESKFANSIQLFDVSHNQLSTLSKDLFCPLSNEVRQLNISHNLLENFDCLGLISQAGQLCLSELRVLDMSYNLIKFLPATGVATLQNLEVLNLSHNLIESLHELSLSSLFKLTHLDLSHNRIQQLPTTIFHKSSSVQVLKLQSNYLRNNIDLVFLSGLISLEELNLSNNNISHLHDLAFIEKTNLTRVDLSHNHLSGLRQEALRVTVPLLSDTSKLVYSAPVYKPRLHHNGQYAGLTQVQSVTRQQQSTAGSPTVTNVEFYLSSNPFICDCHLEWMRKLQPTSRRSVLSSSSGSRFGQQNHEAFDSLPMTTSLYQNDQPASVIQQSSSSSSDSTATSNNISENVQSIQQQSSTSSSAAATITTTTNQPTSNQQQYYGRIADLDLVKCSPLFRRNSQLKHHQRYASQRAPGTPSDGVGHHNNLAIQVHHANNHLHHHHQPHHSSKLMDTNSNNNAVGQSMSNMIDLLTADSSNFLCRYRSHCFALCNCCEFDACDCEMICPVGCSCYYDSKWETNIIDCSSNNHTVVPDRIPMDVSSLYLDGNNIESLKPSNLIARRLLKTLYLNSSNLQFIANRTFNGLIELQTLYLHDNMLRSLHGYEFEPLAQLKSLYLQSNRLDHINNQTFIYLRSLELLDLSNNRLTSMNLDLFMFIGHHNIRLRQLSIAHNWWSCQCNSVDSFRQILKQKFLVNGGVNIVDRNQLRCYYNSTTVGPLILDGITSLNGGLSQPLFGSFLSNGNSNKLTAANNKNQQLLTEINQCSDMIEEGPHETDVNPPIIYTPPPPLMINEFQSMPPKQNTPPNDSPEAQSNFPNNVNPYPSDYPYYQSAPQPQPPSSFDSSVNSMGGPPEMSPQPSPGGGAIASASMPMTSFIVVSVLFVCIFVVAISIFVFVRQQQRYHQHNHHKKSSAISTTSVSSSVSSTAISTGAHHHHHHGTSKFAQHNHHLHLPQPPHFGHTLQQHQLIMATNGHQQQQQQQQQMSIGPKALQHHHQHSTSSQSNIYAALVPPTNGNSTIVTNIQQQQQHNVGVFSNNSNNLYSNSSTTASHHSSSNSSQHNGHQNYPATTNNRTNANWHQQPLYGSQMHQHNGQLYGQVNSENPYAINASVASYKTGASLYNAPMPPMPNGAECHGSAGGNQSDWISLPKVKQLMSKLVNKSLALGGYRSGHSRDELSDITSDKIYDAFLSYDKRDEPFVMQYLSTELEYGSPPYRIANRYRDLPLPTSAYIAEAITSVIGCSHRTIVVLTANYLSSDWCRYELEAALREASLDKSHKIIAVVMEPKCLQDMDSELRNLLLAATGGCTLVGPANVGGGGQQPVYNSAGQQTTSQQLVQLADGGNASPATLAGDFFSQQQHQLVATLTDPAAGSQQVCTQTAATAASSPRLTFINYNERKFWPKIRQLMPVARPSTQTLTLTTKN